MPPSDCTRESFFGRWDSALRDRLGGNPLADVGGVETSATSVESCAKLGVVPVVDEFFDELGGWFEKLRRLRRLAIVGVLRISFFKSDS